MGGQLRVTTAHGPRRWHGKSEKLFPSPAPAGSVSSSEGVGAGSHFLGVPLPQSGCGEGGSRPGPRSVTLAARLCPLPLPSTRGALPQPGWGRAVPQGRAGGTWPAGCTSTCRPPANVVWTGPAALLVRERNLDVPQGP